MGMTMADKIIARSARASITLSLEPDRGGRRSTDR